MVYLCGLFASLSLFFFPFYLDMFASLTVVGAIIEAAVEKKKKQC